LYGAGVGGAKTVARGGVRFYDLMSAGIGPGKIDRMLTKRCSKSAALVGFAVFGLAAAGVAVGAMAIGALAIGALGINHFGMGTGRIEELSIGKLTVDELVVKRSEGLE
jgi:hypothetical protein